MRYTVNLPALALGASLVLLLGGSARAEDPPVTPPAAPRADTVALFFAQFDANQDGAVSKEELPGVPEALFALLDRNANGRIEWEEARQSASPPRSRPGRRAPERAGEPAAPIPEMPSPQERLARLREAFDKRDQNKDGVLDGQETSDRMRQRVDGDGDGKVTFDEYSAALQRMGPGGPGPEPASGLAPTPAPPSAAEPPGPAPAVPPGAPDSARPAAKRGALPDPQEAKAWDADADGRLNRSEWKGSQDAWLKLDADRDGWVTLAELSEQASKPRRPADGARALETGQRAPDFALAGHDGATHTLAAHLGQIVVLEWVNYDCPFVKPLYEAGQMQALQRKWCDRGVIWFSICSSGPGKQGHRSAQEHARTFTDWKLACRAVLLDPEGTTGRAFGARTTPHVFVLDAQGQLAYDGAPDNRSQRGRSGDVPIREFLDEALEALTSGQAPATARSQSYG